MGRAAEAQAVTQTEEQFPTTMHPSALLHGFEWSVDDATVEIGDGVHLGRVRGSEVAHVYRQLCRSRHVDDGDPFGFEVFVSVLQDSPADDRNLDVTEPYSTPCRVANLLSVATGSPSFYARMIWPKTEHWPAGTRLLWGLTQSMWPLQAEGMAPVTRDTLELMRRMWASANPAGPQASYGTRLNTALTYFQNCWRSHYLDQACLHLSVTLEVLFAPHSQSETTHQISFNLAHFLGGSDVERETLYEATRAFYRIRSAIIHGGDVDYRKLDPATAEMFLILARALRRILGDELMAKTFDATNARRDMLRSYLFS